MDEQGQWQGEQIVAESWAHLAELIFAGTWNPALRRFRMPVAYRGVGRTGRSLRSSLSRLGGDYAEKERHLLRNFRKYARRTFVGDDSLWNWLSLAQHHGLPSRLLDWTYSPYVALHFATIELEHYDSDGEIVLVNFSLANRVLPAQLSPGHGRRSPAAAEANGQRRGAGIAARPLRAALRG